MRARLSSVLLGFAGFVALGALPPVDNRPRQPLADPARPNIVVFYLDDVNSMDGRLWGNPDLTPNLYDLFVAHGVHWPHYIGETSLCCPSRATLLTGLHTHNHLVKVNDVQLFNPGENVGKEMQASGYASMLIGKYMNRPESLTSDQWLQHSAGWSVFDVFSSHYSDTYGYFDDYTLFTKDQGFLTPAEHSTQMVGERAVSRFAAVDPSTPIFAVLSISDTHLPNIPMPGFENDPRWTMCDSMPPWDPPSYNEADVSDKPSYVQSRTLFPYPDGWPVTTYCKEMLGVDWLVGQVTDELKAEGRFDNTMFVFTADNGMSWGEHRLELKETPYSTPVPLYFSWQSRWGTDPRTIDEYASDIDLAPTFCDYAGCSLGPYPTGQTKPDGVSLKPVLEGTGPPLARDALLEDEYRIHPWAGLITTDVNPLGLWHYVENANGFKELYNVDPDEDPWELQNVASDPAYADIVDQLHDRLIELLSEGRPDAAGSITVVEDSVPNANQDFSFSGDLGSFLLDDDANATLPRQRTFSGLASGDYTITQAQVSGSPLISISCPPTSDLDLSSGAATVHLQPGDTAYCTFKNARLKPDAAIALAQTGPFKGSNVYAITPLRTQTQRRDHVAVDASYEYWMTFQNDGRGRRRLLHSGCRHWSGRDVGQIPG